jgi:hypothetical protein
LRAGALRAVVLRAVDFRAAGRLAVVLRAVVLRAVVLRAAVFRAGALRAAVFRAAGRLAVVLRAGVLRADLRAAGALAVVVRSVDVRAAVFIAGALRAAVFRAAVRLAVVLRAVVLRAAVFRAGALRAVVLRAVVLRAAVFRAGALRAAVLRAVVLRAVVLRRAGALRTAFFAVARFLVVVFVAIALLRFCFDDASTRSTRRVHRITLDLVQACRPTWRVNYFFQHTFVATKNGNLTGTFQCTSTTNSLWSHRHLSEIVHRCAKRIAPPNTDVTHVSPKPTPVACVMVLSNGSYPRRSTKTKSASNAKRKPTRRLGRSLRHVLQGRFKRHGGDVRVPCKREIKGESEH